MSIKINKEIFKNTPTTDNWEKDYDIHIIEKRKESIKKIKNQNRKDVSDWIKLKSEYLDNI